MKIRYSKSVLEVLPNSTRNCHFVVGSPGAPPKDLTREGCIAAGVSDAEIDHAVAAPDTWIDCPRETTVTGDASEVMAGLKENVERLTEQRDATLGACVKAIAYDEAIRSCADDPKKMASFCTAEGESLDALYAAWIVAARGAVALGEKAKGER